MMTCSSLALPCLLFLVVDQTFGPYGPSLQISPSGRGRTREADLLQDNHAAMQHPFDVMMHDRLASNASNTRAQTRSTADSVAGLLEDLHWVDPSFEWHPQFWPVITSLQNIFSAASGERSFFIAPLLFLNYLLTMSGGGVETGGKESGSRRPRRKSKNSICTVSVTMPPPAASHHHRRSKPNRVHRYAPGRRIMKDAMYVSKQVGGARNL